MAVPEQTPYVEYEGNGTTTVFPLTFECDVKENLVVTINDVVVDPLSWNLVSDDVVFLVAPVAGSLIALQRNSPLERTTNYQTYDNSLRPEPLNLDFDRIWWKLQETNVISWLITNKLEKLKIYVDTQDEAIKNELLAEIEAQGVALDQLKDYYDYLFERLAQIATDNNWDASFIVDGDLTQHQINFGVAAPLIDRAALKLYAGQAKLVNLTGSNESAYFIRDDSDLVTADNNLDVIVDAISRRWKMRLQYWEPIKQKCFAENIFQTNAAIGGTLTIACFGDSMTYGQDTVSTTGDLQPGINGSSTTRALYQYPEALGAALTAAGYNVTVNNYGFPGDTSATGLTRWPSTPAANIAFIMYGHNDANVVSGQPTVSPSDYKRNITKMILREQRKGAYVILLTPPRLKESNLTGATVQRQQFMRAFESVHFQLSKQFGVPCVSVDELVAHRGAEIYCDTVHFNKYGYNEWGWNLSALIIQRSDSPKRFSAGSIMYGSGSSHQGTQTVVDGRTVMVCSTTTPITISGYFEEDLIPVVRQIYNTAVGGTQRIKIEMDGGIRNTIVPRKRVGVVSAAPGKYVKGDVIKKGYRTFQISVASTTSNAYIQNIEFVSVNSRQFTDVANLYSRFANLTGMYVKAATENNRWIIDDSSSFRGDFYAELLLSGAPTSTDSVGISLISQFDEATGIPTHFISMLRIGASNSFTRLAAPPAANQDEQLTGKFTGSDTLIAIERIGTTINCYAEGVLIKTFTGVDWGRVYLSLFRNNAAIDCKYLTVR